MYQNEPSSSFVSKMIIAMFWTQLPIQIAVADSKIQVRIGNRQLDRIDPKVSDSLAWAINADPDQTAPK